MLITKYDVKASLRRISLYQSELSSLPLSVVTGKRIGGERDSRSVSESTEDGQKMVTEFCSIILRSN